MGWGGLGWVGCGKWTARKLNNSFTECLAGVARFLEEKDWIWKLPARCSFLERSPESSIQKYLQMSRIFPHSMTLLTRKRIGMAGKTLNRHGTFRLCALMPGEGFLLHSKKMTDAMAGWLLPIMCWMVPNGCCLIRALVPFHFSPRWFLYWIPWLNDSALLTFAARA